MGVNHSTWTQSDKLATYDRKVAIDHSLEKKTGNSFPVS